MTRRFETNLSWDPNSKKKCKGNLFTHGTPSSSQELVQKCPCILKSNWNLEMLLLKERRKPEYLEKNLAEQGKEPTTNSTHIWRRVQESSREVSALTTAPSKLPSNLIITDVWGKQTRWESRIKSRSNRTLAAMPNEFAKEKGLWWVPWPGRNELRKTSQEIITRKHVYHSLP